MHRLLTIALPACLLAAACTTHVTGTASAGDGTYDVDVTI